MASQVFEVYAAPSLPVYLRVRNSAGQWLDFNDGTFKAWASATTPYVSATASALRGGTSEYVYQATIDLDDLNTTETPVTFAVEACSNASPSLTDDLIAEADEIIVQGGDMIAGEAVVCQFDGAFTTTEGTVFRGIAWVERGGQFIPLASGSCSVAVREQGAGVDLFSMTASAVNADGAFDLSKTSPGFTDDRVYAVTVSITSGGKTYVSRHSLQVQAA